MTWNSLALGARRRRYPILVLVSLLVVALVAGQRFLQSSSSDDGQYFDTRQMGLRSFTPSTGTDPWRKSQTDRLLEIVFYHEAVHIIGGSPVGLSVAGKDKAESPDAAVVLWLRRHGTKILTSPPRSVAMKNRRSHFHIFQVDAGPIVWKDNSNVAVDCFESVDRIGAVCRQYRLIWTGEEWKIAGIKLLAVH